MGASSNPCQDTRLFQGLSEYAGGNEFISLVEIRERVVGAKIGFVLRSVVAIEVGGGVSGLAVGVVGMAMK